MTKLHRGVWTRVFFLGLTAAAMTVGASRVSAALPGPVAFRVKQIGTALAAADKALDKNQLTTAQRKLADAQRIYKEIQSRYAANLDTSDPEYAAMVTQLNAAVARFEAAAGKASDTKAAADRARAEHEALCKAWIERFRPFSDHRGEHYLPTGASLNNLPEADQAKARAAAGRARTLFAEFQAVAFALPKTVELQNQENHLRDTLGYYGGIEADAAQEAACREWIEQLAPYVEVGMGSPKRLIASPTASSEQIERQQALYEEAKAMFAIYKQAAFPQGKTYRLKQIEQAMETTLAAFPEAMAKSHAMVSGNVDTRLDGVLDHFARDTRWQTDAKQKPPILMARDLEPLRAAVADYAKQAPKGDAKLAGLRRKLKRIEELDTETRQVWAQRTFQKPDGYKGTDMEMLKREARLAAEKAHPQGKVRHVTVPSADWAIETVVEFTDTTKTALRRRTTRSVRAQVAVQEVADRCWLIGVYVGQDRLPNGQWGQLQAHTTWTDPMVKANVGQFKP